MTITASKNGIQDLPMRQLLKILISPSRFVNSCHSTVYLYFLNDLDNILILKLMLLHIRVMNQCRNLTPDLTQCNIMLAECIPCQLSVAYV
jgi:hypothetical protein